MTGELVTSEVRRLIGLVETYRAPEPLGAASIRYFGLAVGADPQRAPGEAPPTLICETCQLTGRTAPDANGYLGHSWDLPFPVPCTMVRGGNDYRFHRPAQADDLITTRWELTGVVERLDRRGQPMAVVTAVATYLDADGRLLATNTESSIHRPSTPADRAPPENPRPTAGSTSAAAPAPGPGRTAAAVAPGPSVATTGRKPAAADAHRLPDLVRRLDLTDLVAYGAATWDWHRLHYDPGFAQAAGMAAPVVDGQLFGALLAEQILRARDSGSLRSFLATDGGRPPGRISRLHFRNRAPVVAGSTVVCESTVVDSTPGAVTIDSVILVGDETVVAPAGATVTVR